MKLQIKNRFTGDLIIEGDFLTVLDLVKHAISVGADLSRADLSRADLSGADLSRANLIGADLSGANLSRADLSRADLSRADLSRANLIGANLIGADLIGADLSGANLSRADLSRANLIGADLSGANLTPIRDDIWAVMCSAPAEVPALRQALVDGRVDGSTYSGSCSCLVGTLANARNVDAHSIPGLATNSNRPAERFFMGIRRGDKPADNQFSKLALKWVEEWQSNMKAAFHPEVTVS